MVFASAHFPVRGEGMEPFQSFLELLDGPMASWERRYGNLHVLLGCDANTVLPRSVPPEVGPNIQADMADTERALLLRRWAASHKLQFAN
eukprot:13975016-Alexandrium_andersonii.AAC.1